MDVPEDEDEDKGEDGKGTRARLRRFAPNHDHQHPRSCMAGSSLMASVYLIDSQYLREGVEDLLVCSGNM